MGQPQLRGEGGELGPALDREAKPGPQPASGRGGPTSGGVGGSGASMDRERRVAGADQPSGPAAAGAVTRSEIAPRPAGDQEPGDRAVVRISIATVSRSVAAPAQGRTLVG